MISLWALVFQIMAQVPLFSILCAALISMLLIWFLNLKAFDYYDVRRSYLSLWPLTVGPGSGSGLGQKLYLQSWKVMNIGTYTQEYACNFMFMIVSFCGSIALLSLCYWSSRPDGYCDYWLDGKEKVLFIQISSYTPDILFVS